jgi:hypothetical protein
MIGAKNRYVSRVKALRKCKLDLQITLYSKNRGFGLYDNLHQYSKNKIHCSCPLCSAKTRNKGRRVNMCNNWAPSINYSISDLKKVQSMNDKEEEYFSDT